MAFLWLRALNLSKVSKLLLKFPCAELMSQPTLIERLDRLSDKLDIDLWLKRDDLTGLTFEGNKTHQLEYYMGAALAKKSNTILITGAVQSARAIMAQYCRRTVSCDARLCPCSSPRKTTLV